MSHRRRPSVRGRPEWQCRYRGGECTNARATKLDGTLHHLCQDHRLRANWNQRQSQNRRRDQRRRAEEAARATRRRQGGRTEQLRRLNYAEWLQIVDSLEWQEPIADPVSEWIQPIETISIAWENDLFAPLAEELTIAPTDQDMWMQEQYFYLLDSDVSTQLPSQSGEDHVPDSDSN